MVDTTAYFHQRQATKEVPCGWTVSRKESLPSGDFRITEYRWGPISLWFVDADEFTADERQAAYWAYVSKEDFDVEGHE